MTPLRAIRTLRRYVRSNLPAMMAGAPGIGKSDLARLLAVTLSAADLGGASTVPGIPIIDIRAVLLDAVDAKGLPIPVVESGWVQWLPPGFLPRADRDGEFGILLLDELDKAPAMVQASFLQLTLDGRLGDYVLPPGWRIVACINRVSDRAGSNRIITALANRFSHIDIEADPESWRAWGAKAGIHPAVLAFAGSFRPALLHKFDPADPDARAFPSPRSWHFVSRHLQANPELEADPVAVHADSATHTGAAEAVRQGKAALAKADRLSDIAGIVGIAAACEFEGFFRSWQELSKILPAIAVDPDTAPVPSEPSTRYALVTALAARATRESVGKALRYATRLDREFEVLLGVTINNRGDGALTTAPGFSDWALRNSDVTL